MNPQVDPTTTFRTGFAASRHAIALSGAMDAFDPGEPYTRLFIYSDNAPDRWMFSVHDHVVPSICTWRDPEPGSLRYFAAVAETGIAIVLTPEMQYEDVADGGLHRPGASGYGYLNDIQQIGDRLYACGFSGQVYQRRGPGDWVHMDDGLLQPPGPDMTGRYFVEVIGGASERSIYVAGSEMVPGHPGRVDHWDGRSWTRVVLPRATGRITNMLVESESRIWFCGAGGTLLRGNATDGFVAVHPPGDRRLLTSVALFGDTLYLASDAGLLRFDPRALAGVFRPVRTGLAPELTDANVVQVADGVLWSLGTKDIARFDGVSWERLHHPDNPPVAATAAPP